MDLLRYAILLCLCSLPAVAEFHSISAQTKVVNIESLLVADHQNIVCFFTSSSNLCRALYPDLQKLGSQPKLDLHLVEVGTLQTPTAKKYALTSVPYFQIYNGKGELISDGPAAYKQVMGMIQK